MASYLLNYDLGPMVAMHPQLLGFVKENRHVKQWSHPYPGLFLLKSDADLPTLATSFQSFFTGSALHMIVPINPSTAQGIMPVSVWQWLNQPEQQSLGLLNYLQQMPKE